MLHTLPNELILQVAEQLTSRNEIYCLLLTCKDLSTILQPQLNKEAKKIQDAAAAKKLPLIHFAAFEDSYPIAKLALKLDPTCINTPITIYGTPLVIASWKTFPMMVEFLIANGANPNAQDPEDPLSDTPLSRALRNIITQQRVSPQLTTKRTQVIQQLLDGGADPRISGHNFLNALLDAASKRVPELITSIMETGLMDINTRSPNGGTALHAAVAVDGKGATGVIKELLRYGIDVNAVNDYGHSALFNSCSEDNTVLLIEHGIDVNMVNIEGQTVFHSRAKCPYHGFATRRIREILCCTNLANLSILDNMGRSPLDYAIYTQNMEAIKLLVDYEAIGYASLDGVI